MAKIFVTLATTAIILLMSGTATGSTSVYTDETTFDDAFTGLRWGSVPLMGDGTDIAYPGTSYTSGAVTFSGSRLIFYTDIYPTPYIAFATSVSTQASALGLLLGSYYDNQVISYTVGCVTGLLSIAGGGPETFLGFGDPAGPISVTFAAASELDFPAFVTNAAPEPSTWVLMLAGLGAVGAALRQSRRLRKHLILSTSKDVDRSRLFTSKQPLRTCG